ncbi:MAG: penicillin-binding protein 2 [Deltaproteobacteria bacterium]|nr:penicillin-binding protein 2 [Deltaproteobacteria bacterium]
MTLERHFQDDLAPRVTIVAVAIGCFFALLAVRLFYLQIVQREVYASFAGSRGIRTERIRPERGMVIDRSGRHLMWNNASFAIVAVPQYLGDAAMVSHSVASLLEIDTAQIAQRLKRHAQQPRYRSIPLVFPASHDAIARLLAWQTPWHRADAVYDLRGVTVEKTYTREYRDGTLAPHLLGYVKEIDAAELERSAAQYPGQYVRGDDIGATGIEGAWDPVLRGTPGYRERLVDARGYEITSPPWFSLHTEQAMPGATLQLAIDLPLQEAAHRALGEQHGAVVAIEPKTGAILAMVSHPGFDLARLQQEDRQAYWRTLTSDVTKPLYHRAVLGTYPPGSIYKMVVAMAALSEGVVTPQERVTCRGALHYGGRSFRCWRRGGHGAVDLRHAIAGSCDVFFYTMGLRLGPDRLAKYARRFGLGLPTGIDLPHESSGLIPTTAWKERVRHEPWQGGETLSIAIGQGYDTITPIQAAVMVSAIANGGHRVVPYIVERAVTARAVSPINGWRVVRQHLPLLRPAYVQQIHEGLIDVVNAPYGTARRLVALKRKIAGKTGTAQVVSLLRAQGIRSHHDHAWFVAYAPYDDPKIAVAVLVEHGGSGSRTASPIAGAVIAAYLEGQP